MSKLKGLKAQLTEKAPPPAVETAASATAKSREGKVPVIGYFSPELRRELKTMAAQEGGSVQALMGEAFDLLMRARDKHPFGER